MWLWRIIYCLVQELNIYMKFPIIELVDRYAIAVVKHRKTNGANQEEVDFYHQQLVESNINPQHHLIDDLITHHTCVWNLEDDFKKGRVDNLPLEEIGRRALAIRDMGHDRVALKNALADLVDDPVKEIKQYNGV